MRLAVGGVRHHPQRGELEREELVLQLGEPRRGEGVVEQGPAELSGRWARGERVGLVSPIAMMSFVTVATAIIGFVVTRWTGHREAAQQLRMGDLLMLAPFLKTTFPQQVMAAAGDPQALTDAFRTTGGWFAALWPALFVVPGWLALLPPYSPVVCRPSPPTAISRRLHARPTSTRCR